MVERSGRIGEAVGSSPIESTKMLNRILLGLSVVLFVYFLSDKSFFSDSRKLIENNLTIPARNIFNFKNTENSKAIKVAGLEEKIKELKEENELLRSQLGSIPSKSHLFPVKIIWETANEYYLAFNYPNIENLKNNPLIYQNIFLGTVSKAQGNTVVVKKPNHSQFLAMAKTEAAVVGKLKGQYNEHIIFETDIKSKLTKDSRIYYIDPTNGWIFLVGKIRNLVENKRLPVKSAIITSAAEGVLLKQAFIVL